MTGQVRDATAALVWLRWRETVGRHGTLATAALVLWCTTIAGLLAVGPGLLDYDASGTLLAAASGSWLAWAVAPLIGAGGNEVAGGNRLHPYPVGEPAVFWSTWVTAFLDVPSLLILPATVGLAWAVAGPFGVLLALTFAGAATAVGQAFAWSAAGVLAGRARGWVMLIGTSTVVMGGLGAAGLADDVARALPGGWLATGARAAGHGDLAVWAALLVALAVTAVGATHCAYRAFTWSRGREALVAQSKGASRSLPASVPAALVAAWARSMLRAPTARLLLAGSIVAPLLARLADVQDMAVTSAIPAVVLACTVSLGVNAFAFDGGGATLVLAAPIAPRVAAVTKAVALWLTIVSAVTAAFVVAVAAQAVTGHLWDAPLMIVGYTAALAGASTLWSARFPSAADHSSLRSRPAPLRSSVGFMVTAGLTVTVVDVFRTYATWAALPAGVILGAVLVLRAGRRLARRGEDVAVAVSR